MGIFNASYENEPAEVPLATRALRVGKRVLLGIFGLQEVSPPVVKEVPVIIQPPQPISQIGYFDQDLA